MRFSRSDGGQAEVLGVALLLGILVLGTTAVLALGGAAVDQTQSSSRLENAEHSMTLFDSRAAMVALGGSGTQTVSFGRGGGDFRVDEDAGTLRVVHVDADDSVTASPANDEVLYEGTLGTVVYTSGDTDIAYQAGGVWRKGAGEARMVSPPEFHYRQATLTLPVVRVEGSGGAGGDGASRVTLREVPDSFDREYPNSTRNYTTIASRQFVNPVQKGFIRIEVESEYYEGWGEYFRTRTDGQVSVFDGNQTARLDLITVGTLGQFDFSGVGDRVPVRGFPADGHSLDEFQVTLWPSDTQSSKFNNLKWSLAAEEGDRQLELAVTGNGAKCGDTVPVVIYYSDDGGTTYESWKLLATVEDTGPVGCSDDPVYLPIDFTDDSQTVTYTSDSSLKLYRFDGISQGEFGVSPAGTLAADDDHAEQTLADGDTRNVTFVVSHYFSEFGSNIEFEVYEGNNAGQCYAGAGDCTPSNGFIDYPGNGKVVTYLHVTENGVEVTFD